MKPLKSSKKINTLAVIFLLIIGMTFGVFLVLKSKIGVASISEQLSQILEQDKKTINECKPNPDDKNKDSDNDGLMNWQEITWKTNPCKPDTDEDGYLDGEETTSGYDPTQPAPNDKLPGQNPNQPRALPINLTQALAKSLSEQSIKGGTETISGILDVSSLDTSNQIIDTAIQTVINKAMREFTLPNIPDQDIIISPDNSQTSIENYAGKIVEIINQLKQKTSVDKITGFESESDLFYYAIQSKDFSQINQYIEFYRKLYENIKQIPTPSDLKEIHKEQLGIFWVMSNIYKAIKEIDQDPLKTNLALEQYKAVSDLTNQMFQKLANYIESHP
ncbi:MAG: thrombospondin type 3 repeat-containing protein [bacterium]